MKRKSRLFGFPVYGFIIFVLSGCGLIFHLPIGGDCVCHEQCDSGLCIPAPKNLKCVATQKVELGGTCDEDEDCKSRNCSSEHCTINNEQCAPRDI